jgi:hypothetical protein
MVTKMMLWRRAIASLLALWSMVCFAAAEPGGDPGAAPLQSAVERIVVFADVHGAYDELVTLLRATHILDANLDWAGGATHLVSLGDLIDRGPKSRQVLDLVIRLQQQAASAGGAVHVVLGNHELMNLTGDLRYLVAQDYVAFAGDETPQLRAAAFARYRVGRGAGLQPGAAEAAFDAKYPAGFFARQEAFAATGRYGAWLSSQPIVAVIDDYAFVHGGLAPAVAASTVEELNDQFHRDVGKLLGIKAQIDAAGYGADDAAELARTTDRPDGAAAPDADESALAGKAAEFIALLATPLLSDGGPLWYRGTALCHGLIEQDVVERGLAALHAKAAIIGHTPTSDRRVQQRFAGKVVMLDTGMLETYFHGHPAALVLEGERANVVYGDGAQSGEIEDADAVVRSGWSRDALERFLADAPIGESQPRTSTELALQLRDGPRTLPAIFVAGNKSSINAQLSAYRLDVLLGLDLVPVSVARTVDGVAGVIATAPDRAINEAERRQQQQVRPSWCASGNDYQLMYVFDALIGNLRRTAVDISYDRTSWQMQLTGNGAAFPTTKTLPKLADGVSRPVPNALAKRLAQLDFDSLQREFGELLNKQQLKALLARRDAILATWQRAD